jgi:putative nucleotidyltransferase with HDIG domain
MNWSDAEELQTVPKDVLAALRALRPLSAVAIQLQLLADEELAMNDVAEIIKADAALSADILRLANSPLFGLRQPPTGILHALALLGLRRLMTLVMTAAIGRFSNPARDTPALRRCWRHNLACGLICEDLADAAGLDRDMAYTAGLLHDIGRTGMLCVWTSRYSHLLDETGPDPVGLLASERQDFGISHTTAGAFLLRDWRLPEIFSQVAGRHHDPPNSSVKDYVGLVHRGCALADRLGFVVTAKPADAVTDGDPALWRALLPELPDGFGFAIAERINSLEAYLLR